ncbi:MAG: DUF3307 domain-containing protein [Bacillaceae bacterium]|nr:DUF3307 domain-containing protein [Bacillaceae bacterium]
MSPFDFLLVAHLIGDYLFQTNWMAMNKARRWDALMVHSIVYTGVISIVSWMTFGGLSMTGILIVFLSHLILDRRRFIVWWVRRVMRTDETKVPWIVIVVDQVFHIMVLAIILYI